MFLLRTLRKKSSSRFMTVRAAFQAFDTDGSGSLDCKEIKAIFTRPGGGAALTDGGVP